MRNANLRKAILCRVATKKNRNYLQRNIVPKPSRLTVNVQEAVWRASCVFERRFRNHGR